MPENIIEIIGQCIGFVAIAIAFLSFQAKSRGGILVIQAIANVVWAVHFFMIGSITGCIINAFCVLRNLVYSQKDRWRWVSHIATPILVSVLAVAISVTGTILTGGLTKPNGWLDFLLLPSTVVSSVAFFLDDERLIRAFSIFVSLSWLIFNIFTLSISGMLAEIFNLTSITIAIIRFTVKRKPKQ